jgi:regulator of protease activity HflC (stomatin/prohibitin superfamily)
MRMEEIEIYDYARQLLEAHGEMAVVEAAQKARSFEEKGQTEDAETWRSIEAALKMMRGPHVS